MSERLLVPCCIPGLAGGKHEISCCLFRVSRCARVEKMVSQRRSLRFKIRGIDVFDGLGNARMNTLPARQAERLRQRLPHELMHKAVACIAAHRLSHYVMRLLGFFDCIERGIGMLVLEFLEQAQAEAAPDDCGCGQHAASVLAQAVKPASQHKAQALRHMQLVCTQPRLPVAEFVEELAFLREMAEDLFDKEWIALRLIKYDARQRRRWSLPAHGGQHGFNAADRKPSQRKARTLPLTQQDFQ